MSSNNKSADLRKRILPSMSPSPAKPSPPSLVQPNRDLSLLHPIVRNAVTEVLRALDDRLIHFAVFEGYRSPARQEYLYAQGRTRPGSIVTRARGWESYHQYGLAVDLVLFGKATGRWSWETKGAEGEKWEAMHEVGAAYELEPLSFELPHLQLSGVTLSQLKSGKFPSGGDESWWANLKQELGRK